MTRCSGSPRKRRHPLGRGRSDGYRKGMRGHSWKKLIKDGEHIGRKCERCNKVVLNAKGRIYKDKGHRK